MSTDQLPQPPEPSWAKRGYDLHQLENYGRLCADEAVKRERSRHVPIHAVAGNGPIPPVDGRNLRSAADLGCVPSKTDLRMYSYKPGGI